MLGFGDSNTYTFVDHKSTLVAEFKKAPADSEYYETGPPKKRLIDIEFYGNSDYVEHTYEVENVVDIFSKMTGYFAVVYTAMRLIIDSHVKNHMTKIILETIYTKAGQPLGPEHHGPHDFHHENGYGKGSQAHHGRPGRHPPRKDSRYIRKGSFQQHGNGEGALFSISKERLKIATQMLEEKFDMSEHMVHLYKIAHTQKRILEKLSMDLSS